MQRYWMEYSTTFTEYGSQRWQGLLSLDTATLNRGDLLHAFTNMPASLTIIGTSASR